MNARCGLVWIALTACVPPADPASFAPAVTTTSADVPATAATSSPITITVSAPASAPYRAELLGSKPQTVEVRVTNDGDAARDLSNASIVFSARRGPVPMRCDQPESIPSREPHVVAPHETITFLRELCSLPLPGQYTIDVAAAFGDVTRVATFEYTVTAREKHVPRALASYPNVLAAMGGDLAGVRYTQPEWKSGAYHVVLRVTNASTVAVPLGDASMIFRVTKDGHALACTDTKEVALEPSLDPGESVTTKIPVTCLADVKGGYDIHASLVFPRDRVETELAAIHVEVTDDPHLYLPIWPW